MDLNSTITDLPLGDGEVTARQTPSKSPDTYPFFQPTPPLASSRYNRQLLIPSISLSGQQRISQSKILIVGLGGLGSPASLYLAGAGVHTLGLLDHDSVEQSNLHRQIIHRESSLYSSPSGRALSKVASALRSLRELNSEVNYVAHEVRLTGTNALGIIRGYDIVLDCTDNPATRYLVSDCCVALGKTLVSGAAQKLEGQVVVLGWPIYDAAGGELCDRGPCYRCVFPHPPSPDMVRSCSEIGILGPVVGTVGTLMASETLRLIVRDKEERKPTMLLYNAWPVEPRGMFRVIGLRGRRKDCVACGVEDVVREKGLQMVTADSIEHGSMDYESWCGVVEDVRLLDRKHRVSAEDFLREMAVQRHGQGQGVVVDVREEFEVAVGPKIDGGINIPISKVLQNGNVVADGTTTEDELQAVLREAGKRPIYFLCQRGNDSQIAAKKLLDQLGQQTSSDNVERQSGWIGDVVGGFTALERIATSKS